MRRALVFLLLYACGGPSQQQLAETPSARMRRVPSIAPPASTSDRDRERSIQQFDDMEATQNVYEEANHPAPPPQPLPGQPAATKRKAPVEKAPDEQK